jgi:thioredoxin reductase
VLAGLPRALASHSSAHHDLTTFRGREVAVIGGGSSAVDLAALLAEAGARPTLIARSPRLRFFSPPRIGPERWWRRLRKPPSGLGPGWRSFFYANAPGAFHGLPAAVRGAIVRRHLGPASAWPLQARLSGVPTLLQHRLADAQGRGSRVRLGLRNGVDLTKTMDFDHVIAGTGYRPDLARLDFLDAELRGGVSTRSGSPVLTSRFESSVGGLFFLGAASAMSFGPVMRFVFGADYASRTLSAHLTRPRR